MRGLTQIALLCSSAVFGESFLGDVFGPVSAMKEMEAITPMTRLGSGAYHDVRRPENCSFPLEVVIVQDSTDSFDDDFENMVNTQLDAMVKALSKTHPGTAFSLISFRDKPINPFGESPTHQNGGYTDYCEIFEVTEMTNDVSVLKKAYNNRTPNGGMDPAENNFGALLAAAQSDKIQWKSPLASKLIVHVTDAPPHFYGEKGDMKGLTPPSGEFDDADFKKQCVTEFYPTPQQVAGAIKARGAYTAHLVYDPDYFYGLVGKSWQWFNRFQGQTDDFINLLAFDSADFWPKLGSIITALEEIECPPITTPEPTTVTETTVTETTVTETTVTETTVTEATTVPETTKPCSCHCPPEKPGCDEKVYCKDGVYINLGFEPDRFDFEVDVAATD